MGAKHERSHQGEAQKVKCTVTVILASQVPTKIIDTGNEKLFAFIRAADEGNLIAVFNFTDEWTNLSAELPRANRITDFKDAFGGGEVTPTKNQIAVAPYGRLWLI